MANHLSIEKQSLILSLLTEGQSVRATSRIADVSPVTVLKLLLEAGQKAMEIHDSLMTNLKCKFVSCDEQWQFVFCKEKNVQDEEEAKEHGDFWLFVAQDSESKLVPVFRLGKRNMKMTASFMMELSVRVVSEFQLSTDSFAPYKDCVDRVFGDSIHYGQITKMYREQTKEEARKYSPGTIIRTTKTVITGQPNPKRISTSHIERLNLSTRLHCKRYARLTNAYSKSLKHHEAAVALHFFQHNFVRRHETLRCTPCMQAGITNRFWTLTDLLTWNAAKIAA